MSAYVGSSKNLKDLKDLKSGDTVPCRMTGVTLHGTVSPDLGFRVEG